MRKAAAKTTELDDVEQKLVALNAKSQFLAATTNMGFRLAITVVIPIVVGVKLDERFHSAPSMTLAGIFIAAGAGSAAVWSTIKEVNRQQAAEEAESKTRRAKKRA
jgi:F0F1-type ATP synthase assembly protein I